jgi:AraC-like DNA-binding protein
VQQYLFPQPPLSQHVPLLWFDDHYLPATKRERLLPTGSMDLVFDLSGDCSRIFRDDMDVTGATFRDGIICGPHSRYFVLDTSKPSCVAGISFAPGGASRFFRLPLNEFQDRHVSLGLVWGSATSSLIQERLLAAATGGDKLRVLEQVLWEQAIRPIGETRHAAIDYALGRFKRVPHVDTLARITDKAGLSPRRFIQLFSEETGLPPKLYCRIQRFQSVIAASQPGERRSSWANLAADCGYFDQAHFIHDFKAFTGLTPGAYLAVRGAHTNHVPLV